MDDGPPRGDGQDEKDDQGGGERKHRLVEADLDGRLETVLERLQQGQPEFFAAGGMRLQKEKSECGGKRGHGRRRNPARERPQGKPFPRSAPAAHIPRWQEEARPARKGG